MSKIHVFGVNPFRDGDSITDAVEEMYKKRSLDPVGQEDSDVDNDGDSDKSDAYLKNRRKKISKEMQKEMYDDRKGNKIPAAACPQCGGWSGVGGMSQYRNSTKEVMGRKGCTCNKKTRRESYEEEIEIDESDLTPPEVVKGSKRPQDKMAGEKEAVKQGSSDIHCCATKVAHEEWGLGFPVPTMHAEADENGNIEWYDVMFDHGIESKVQTEDLEILDEKSHGHK